MLSLFKRRGFLPVLALIAGAALALRAHSELAPPRAVEIKPLPGTRPLIGLVLGAGGARGYAHVGVLKVLEAEGVQADIIVGSSSGAVVSALYAGGLNAAAIEKMALETEDHELIDFTLSGPGRVRGVALQNYVNAALGNRPIEALEREFAVVATERASHRMTVFNRGDPGLAVRASSSIPNLFWPALIEGTEYVDGALTSRVPVATARRMGANLVIAVDVSWRGAEEALSADVAIRPSTPQGGTLDFSGKVASIKAGEVAARSAMPAIRKRMAEAAVAYHKLSFREK